MLRQLKILDLVDDLIDDIICVCCRAGYKRNPMFRVCVEVKKIWLHQMLNKYGSVAKIAFVNNKPVAQLLYYPEESIPYLKPREGVIRVYCVYNPYREFRHRGIAKALLKSLIEDCSRGYVFNGLVKPKTLITMEAPFKREEYYSQIEFFRRNGFVKISDEEYAYSIRGELPEPISKPEYSCSYMDKGKAIIFYEPQCEFLPIVAHKIREKIIELANKYDKNIDVSIINNWIKPNDYIMRGFNNVIVNGRSIVSQYGTSEFEKELETIIKEI